MRGETPILKQSQLRAQENRSTANEGDRTRAKRGKTHTLKQKTQSQRDHSTASKGDRGRQTRTTLRKTEMKRVTNDLTDTAISSPMALEKTAPAPRPKTFKKQGEIEGQATLVASDQTHGTCRFGPKTIFIPL